jgi:hypothetical protein
VSERSRRNVPVPSIGRFVKCTTINGANSVLNGSDIRQNAERSLNGNYGRGTLMKISVFARNSNHEVTRFPLRRYLRYPYTNTQQSSAERRTVSVRLGLITCRISLMCRGHYNSQSRTNLRRRRYKNIVSKIVRQLGGAALEIRLISATELVRARTVKRTDGLNSHNATLPLGSRLQETNVTFKTNNNQQH